MLKTKNREQIYHKIVFVYTLTYAIYSLFGRFTWLHALVEHTINGVMYSFFAMFGFALLMLDFFVYKNFKKMKYYSIYLLFIVVAIISSLLNMKYGITDNAKTIIWLFVQMGLFTTMGQLFTQKQYDKWLTIFFSISGAIWGFASVVSLYQYLFVDGYVIYMNKRFLRQSLYDNWLFGVFIDPNLGAFVAFIIVLGMIYLFRKYKVSWLRALCVINSIIQLSYIILSGSRSTSVCMICSVSYTIIYLLVRFYQKKKSVKLPVRFISYLLVPLAVAVTISASFNLFRTGTTKISAIISPERHQQEDELVRKDIENNETNNRTDIWKGYIKLLKDKPVFGLSPRNAWNYADKEHPDSYLSLHHYDVHNAYIAVLAGMGIIGFLVLLLEMFCIGKTILPRAVDVEKMNFQYFFALQMILNVAVFIFFYPGIYFTNGIDTLLFWPAIGFALQDAKPLPKLLPKKN